MRRSLLPALLALLWAGFPQILPAVELPQDHPYQKVLRDYLKGLTADDFGPGMTRWGETRRFGLEPEWIDTEEKAYPVWLAIADGMISPKAEVLVAPGEAYTLASVEAADGIRMELPPSSSTNPLTLIWWALWDYPGNPWKGEPTLFTRAFAMASVDLIMMDDLINSPEGRASNRSDYIAGRLGWLTWVYLHTKEKVPKEVAQAYEAGLVRLLARMEEKGPDGRTDNMNTKAVPAMVYLSKATDDPEIRQRAEAYAKRVAALRTPSRVHPVGVIYDAGGIEVSYNGIALYYLINGALSSDWPFLHETLAQMLRFQGWMTLPDPDGYWAGPNHFNSRVGADAPYDQWGYFSRKVGSAMLYPEARYILERPHQRRDYPLLPTLEQMQTSLTAWAEKTNAPEIAPFEGFKVWNRQPKGSWAPRYPFIPLHYRPGFYTEMKELIAKGDPSMTPPLLARDSFEALLPDPALMAERDPTDSNTFFIVRRPSYYVISYTGHLGWHQYINWGGGGLSAYWTPEAGSLLLGRSAGLENNDWDDWRIWPVHAVSGEVSPGDAFSTARLNRKVLRVVYDRESANPKVTVSANLNSEFQPMMRKGFKGRLRGENRYEREIETLPDEVRVTLRLQSDGQTAISELFESLPVYLGNLWLLPGRRDVLEPTRIEIETAEGWREPTPEYTDGVRRIRLTRFKGSAEITFERPRRVRLSPKEWNDNKRGNSTRVRSLQIDLLEAKQTPAPFPSTELRYTIRNTAEKAGAAAPGAPPQ